MRSAILSLAGMVFCCAALAQFQGAANMNAVQALQMLQQRADLAYEAGNYAQAYKIYMRLNEVGDKFSQFRIAALYEDGHHVEQSLVEAYAWSFLAAETGCKAFRDYHAYIKSRLTSDEDIERSRERARELIAQYGIFQQAVKAGKALRAELRNCGSRTGMLCDRVSSASLDCSVATDRLPETRCLRIGSLGLTAVAGSFPAQIRQVQNALRDLINEYNPGRVELGDFELVDEADHGAPGGEQD